MVIWMNQSKLFVFAGRVEKNASAPLVLTPSKPSKGIVSNEHGTHKPSLWGDMRLYSSIASGVF
jgi:hypothetical protein